MRRIIVFITAVAALVGCAATGAQTPHRVGSGAINALGAETVSISTSSALSTPRYTGSIDSLGYQIRTDVTNTAACTVTMYGSNEYNPAVDTLTDLTKWFSVTLTTVAPGLASGVNQIPVQYPMWPWWYVRFGFSGCTGSGSVTVTDARKGG